MDKIKEIDGNRVTLKLERKATHRGDDKPRLDRTGRRLERREPANLGLAQSTGPHPCCRVDDVGI
jgi:hypothetical protein